MNINAFKGIQNTVSKRDIAYNACTDAINVDITDTGGILRRNGYSLAKTLSISTAYSTKDRVSFCISGGQLNRIQDDLSLIPLCASTAIEFCDDKGTLFTTDGKMISGDFIVNLIVPQPILPPTVIITAGNREPGYYTCAYTYTNANGLEGGLSPITLVRLDIKGDVLITPIDLPGYTSTVYAAMEDGSVFFNAAGTPIIPYAIGTGGFPDKVGAIEIMGGKLYTLQNLEELTIVRFSKPMHYHLFDYEMDYVIIPDRGTYIKAAGNTLIIGTINGIYGYSEEGLVKLANYGVVPGRSIVRMPDDSVIIATVRGFCAAMPFTPITQDYVSLPMGNKCSTAVINQNGVNKVIVINDGGGKAFNPAF